MPAASDEASISQFEQGYAKIISATSGALVTTLTMTPFDVIKTRLQTQSSSEPLFYPSNRIPAPVLRTDASTSKVPAQIGSAATCCQSTYFTTNKNSDSLLCKFDPRQSTVALPASGSHAALIHAKGKTRAYHSTPTLRQVASSADCAFPDPRAAASELSTRSAEAGVRQFTGFFDALVKIIRYEGAGTLWRGLGPSLAISIPSQATYMVGYDYLRKILLDRPAAIFVSGNGQVSEIHKIGAPLLAGSLVRASIVTCFSPIELIRTRMQSLPSSASSSDVTRSTLQLVRSQGVGTLWRGLPATLWRDVPFSGIYWASYEVIQRLLTGNGFGEGRGQKGRDTFMTAFISGASAGSIAAAFTNPFDVIKTRRQASGLASSRTTFQLLVEITKVEGIRGLLRGLTPRLAKVAPACGLMISFYEIGLRWTHKNLHDLEMPE